MIRQLKTFPRPGGTLYIDTRDGTRRKWFVPDGSKPAEAKAGVATPMPPKKPPRRIEPKRKGQPSAKSGYTPPVNRTDCEHCLDRTERTAGQKNCSCGEKLVTVYECELYGDCAPTARGTLTTEGVRKCADCKSYKPESA